MRNILINARITAGFTQEQIAKRLGITKNAYQGYEYATRNGSIENWLQLEEIFAIPVKELFAVTPDTTIITQDMAKINTKF